MYERVTGSTSGIFARLVRAVGGRRAMEILPTEVGYWPSCLVHILGHVTRLLGQW